MWTAVAGAVVTALLLALGPQLYDGDEIKDTVRDAVRDDSEIRHTVQFMDEGFDLILPAGFEMSDSRRRMLAAVTLDGGLEKQLTDVLGSAEPARPVVLNLRLTLEGRRNQPIFVDRISPVDIEREVPYSGTFIHIPPQISGSTVGMMFNLDERRPQARVPEKVDANDDEAVQRLGGMTDGHKPGALFFQDNTLTLKSAEEDALFIQAVATETAVSFRIRIDYRIGDRRGELVVDDAGDPFRVTPLNCVSRSRWAPDGELLASGMASYENVWSLKGDFSGLEEISDPRRFELGSPYC
ncbi:hypothetical protein [Micromonospora echinospora]|uniref:hypothetical protein n=1 Tax=Micromonospora echinospora TaxID=1877 RepID=UPI001180EF44|nr:hypothetical protein [Micromonospora echinospora]